MDEFDYVSSLPQTPIEPTNLPKPTDLGKSLEKGFKSTLPQYTRVNESVPQTETESLDAIADRINNTQTGVNYTPNILAPIETGVDTSRFKDVDINLAQIQSGKLEQYAAQSQSYWDRLWNDTKVTGANLGIGFATAFTSIYDMINDGSFIPSEDSVTSNLGKISSEFAEKNTNFQTQYDIDNPIKSLLLPAFLTGSSKGWGDIAKSASIGVGTGAGILVQELGITALTGGTGTIPLLANNIRNLIRNSKVITQAAETASALRAGTTALETGVAAVGSLNAAIQTANTTKNIINFGKNTVRGALSAYGESAFEAQETSDSFTLEKIKEFRDTNGRLPNETELKRIKDVAEQAHDARFLLNFGLLTFSNMPFLNGVFKQFDDVLSVSEQAAAKGLKYTGRAGDGFEKSFQLTGNWWNKNAVTKGMKTALETGQPLAKNILTGKSITWSEGLEEGYQFWVDKATNNYYNTIYNKGTNDIIDSTLTDTVYGLANSFYQTKDQLLSTEGLQNIIGGILGGTGQSIVSKGIDIAKNGFEDQFKEGSKFRTDTNQQVKEGTKELLELQKAINLESITGDLSSKVEAVRGAYTGVGLMQESNSVITFDKLKDITKFHTIAPMVMRGQTDILKDDLTKSLLDVDDEQFKLMTGVQEVNPGIKQKYISDVINDINKVEKSVKRNLSTFRNKYQKGTEEYDLYENAKKVFAFHGYISDMMIDRKKDLESKNSILFNAPNISSALELATQGTNREGLLNQIKQRKTQFESDIQIATPVVKEGEKTEIDIQTQQLIKQAQQKVDRLTALENKVSGFKGENVQEVLDLLQDVLIGFDQLDLVANDDSLNLQNQLDKILNTFTDHQVLSTNLAEHLETYNNLVQNYSDSKKLKETLDKYKEQGMIVQSSFKGLKEFNKYNDVRSYFIEQATEVGLPPESEFFKEIAKGIKELQVKDAEFEEYKELIDKNIEQFQKENKPEEIPDVEEEQPDVETQTADDVFNLDLLETLKEINVRTNIKGVKKDSEDFKTLETYIDQLNVLNNQVIKQEFDTELKTRVLKNIEFLINKINRILNTVTEEEFDVEVDKQEKVKTKYENKVYKLKDNKNLENFKSVLKSYKILENFDFISDIISNYNIKVSFDGKHRNALPKVASIDTAIINDELSVILTINKKNFDKLSIPSKVEVIAHELVHGLIRLKLNEKADLNGTEFYKGLSNIFTETKSLFNNYKNNNIQFLQSLFTQDEIVEIEDKIKYIDKSIEEFATLGLTDPLFKKLLVNLKGNNVTSINENLWSKLSKLVANFLGITNSKFDQLLSYISENLNTDIFKEVKEIETPSGSINSKALETIVYVENGEVLNLKQNSEKLSQLSNNVQDVLLGNKLNIDELDFELTKNKVLPEIVNLKYDTAFKRGTSPDSVQITKNGTFVMLVQSTENLFLDVPLILKHTKGLTKQEIQNFGKTDIRITDALKNGVLTERVFNLMKDVRYNGKKLLELNEDFETFKNIVLTQQEKYNELKSAKDLKSKFKELYELTPYANGMNTNEEGKYVEANFTSDLPFNFIGNWKNPIFTILSDNKISAENVTGISNGEYRDTIAKLKSKLDELKEKNLKFYNILKDQGTFFTAFTTELGEIFIKPIILRKFNNSAVNPLELENKAFDEKGKYIEGFAKTLGEQYVFFAFDEKKNGQSVKVKFVENEGKLNATFVVFSERDSEKEYVDYYLNNLSKEDFQNLLNGKLTKKPQIRNDKKDLGFNNELDVYNLTIVERIKQDVSKLLDGTYKIPDVNNPTSIFQNVGFRLKFKEKQEKEIIPESLVIETPEVEVKENLEDNEFVIKIKKIGSAYAGNKMFVNTKQTGKEFLTQVNYDMYGQKVQPEHLLFFKDRFGGVLYDLVNRGFKELTGKSFEEYEKDLEQKPEPALVEQVYDITEEDKKEVKSVNISEEIKIKQSIDNLFLKLKEIQKSIKDYTEKNKDLKSLPEDLRGEYARSEITRNDIKKIIFKLVEIDLNKEIQNNNLDNVLKNIKTLFANGIYKGLENTKSFDYIDENIRKEYVAQLLNLLTKKYSDFKGFTYFNPLIGQPLFIDLEGKKADFDHLIKNNIDISDFISWLKKDNNLKDKIKDLESLGKENLKSVSDKGLGKEIKTWDKLKDIYKNEEDISLIFSKFEQLKDPKTKKSILLNLKKELKGYFDESINTPVTQRAIIDNKEIEEIAKQYTINCK